MSGGDFVKQKIKLEWPYIINKSDCTVLILHTQRFCDVRSVLCHLLSDFEKVLLSCFCSKLHCKFLAFSLLCIPDDSSRVPFGFQVFSVIFLLLSSSPVPKFLSLLFNSLCYFVVPPPSFPLFANSFRPSAYFFCNVRPCISHGTPFCLYACGCADRLRLLL